METNSRKSSEQEFAVKFNEFYCDARTARTCLKGNQTNLVELARLNSTTAATGSSGSENATAVAVSIWSRCRTVVLKFQVIHALSEHNAEGYPTYLSIYTFLDDCKDSPETNKWCGDLASRASSLSDEEHRESPTPYAANPSMFQAYTRELADNIVYPNVILGSLVGSLALAAVLSE